jgi:Ca-activated chloride channel family protein
MTALLDRLQRPVVHDLAVAVDGAPLDFTPRRLPDLYAGEPLLLLGKGDSLRGRLTVSGMIGDRPWSQSVDLGNAVESPAIARLWAGRKIAEVEAARASVQTDDATANEAIARIGLAYSLVTSQTSLIAVDETPARALGETLTREELPLLLPAGWDFDALFGGRAAMAAMKAANSIGSDVGPAQDTQSLDLPQTATGYAGWLIKGGILLALGLVGLIATRRRNIPA